MFVITIARIAFPGYVLITPTTKDELDATLEYLDGNIDWPRRVDNIVHERIPGAIRTIKLFFTDPNPMIIYMLQVSTVTPMQFKIRVISDHDMQSIKAAVAAGIDEGGFKPIGTYHTPEAVTEALRPYLEMEASR